MQAAVAPLNVLTATPAASSADLSAAAKTRTGETAQKFEAAFLSVMLQTMFEGTEAEAPFDGGAGEAAFRSFLTEALGKTMSQAGGIGLADSVQREMLKMQGLSETQTP